MSPLIEFMGEFVNYALLVQFRPVTSYQSTESDDSEKEFKNRKTW
jgi:hypothetical protein